MEGRQRARRASRLRRAGRKILLMIVCIPMLAYGGLKVMDAAVADAGTIMSGRHAAAPAGDCGLVVRKGGEVQPVFGGC